MNKTTIQIAMAATLALALVAATPATTNSVLDAVIASAIKAGGAPGAQVAVVRDGALVFNRGFGFSNRAKQVRVTNNTQFEIGSVTKQFTAAAILQLKEQGKLKLTDRLAQYVPQYKLGAKVTIEELLRQVSGIPDYLNDVGDPHHLVTTTSGGLDAALKMIAGMPLHFAPGTRWRYSNTNYLLLGAIVARVSGMPYEQYIQQHIFAPAGMKHSAFIADEPRLAEMATGYRSKSSHPRAVTERIGDGWAGGAGAIVSTAGDVAKWDEAFFGGRIVSPADVKLATTPALLPSGASTHYGFGWGIDTLYGQPLIWHNGGSLGFVAQNDYFPKQHEAVIALINDIAASSATIADRAFGAMNPAIAAASNKAAPNEEPRITALAKKWLAFSQSGTLDKSELTSSFAKFLTPDRVRQAQQGLAPLGAPTAFIYRGKQTSPRGTLYTYRVVFTSATMTMIIGIDAAGKINGIGFRPI